MGKAARQRRQRLLEQGVDLSKPRNPKYLGLKLCIKKSLFDFIASTWIDAGFSLVVTFEAMRAYFLMRALDSVDYLPQSEDPTHVVTRLDILVLRDDDSLWAADKKMDSSVLELVLNGKSTIVCYSDEIMKNVWKPKALLENLEEFNVKGFSRIVRFVEDDARCLPCHKSLLAFP